MVDCLSRTEVMITMGVLLVARIGLMIYLRMRPQDE